MAFFRKSPGKILIWLKFSETWEPDFKYILFFFRESCRWKLFFRLVKTYLWENPSFRILERDFLSSGNHLLYLKVFSPGGNRHWYEWKGIFKNITYSWWWNLVCFLASGNQFLPLSQIFFKESFISVSGSAFFSPREHVLFLIQGFLAC